MPRSLKKGPYIDPKLEIKARKVKYAEDIAENTAREA